MPLLKWSCIALTMLLSTGITEAKKYAHPHSVAGFTCGIYMATRHPEARAKIYTPLALNWAKLPHTSPHPGAIVVQSRHGRALGGGLGGHVSEIISVMNPCSAVVIDNKHHEYIRNICRNLVAFVSPEGEHNVSVVHSMGHHTNMPVVHRHISRVSASVSVDRAKGYL